MTGPRPANDIALTTIPLARTGTEKVEGVETLL